MFWPSSSPCSSTAGPSGGRCAMAHAQATRGRQRSVARDESSGHARAIAPSASSPPSPVLLAARLLLLACRAPLRLCDCTIARGSRPRVSPVSLIHTRIPLFLLLAQRAAEPPDCGSDGDIYRRSYRRARQPCCAGRRTQRSCRIPAARWGLLSSAPAASMSVPSSTPRSPSPASRSSTAWFLCSAWRSSSIIKRRARTLASRVHGRDRQCTGERDRP